MTKIVLYGLGAAGSYIARHLIDYSEKMDIEIIAVMDKKGGKFDTFCVRKPDELKNMQYDAIIVTSDKWLKQIEHELINTYHVDSDKIFSLCDFMQKKVSEIRTRGTHDEIDWLYCNLCLKESVFGFTAGVETTVFHQKTIIGGGRRENAVCPCCGSLDRERFVHWVLMNKTNIYQSQGKILHFAPEKGIERRLREKPGYRTADIRPVADEMQDITNIKHEDASFDFIILNHVMEHVADERRAFRELARCIKPDGKIILSVPICWEGPTVEVTAVKTDEERLRLYGQKNHVRLYGNDIGQRLESMGFQVTKFTVKDDVPQEEAAKMNLIMADTVWVLEKKQTEVKES